MLKIPQNMLTLLKLKSQEYNIQISCNIIIKFTDQKFKGSGIKPENKFKDASQYHKEKDRNTSSTIHCIPLHGIF